MNSRLSILCRSEAHQRHRPHQRDAAREGHVAGGINRIIEQFLQHRRGQSQGRQQDEADGEEHDRRKNEIAVLEQRLVEKMHVRRHDVHDER